MIEPLKTNGNGTKGPTWHWLALVAISAAMWLGIQLYNTVQTQSANAITTLTARVSSDETTISADHDTINSIRSDVSYIKGLLQQKYGITTNASVNLLP